MQTTFKHWLKTRRGKQASWAAGALVVYALTGFLLLPWILQRVVPRQLGEVLGRQVTIERIRINPFALSGSFRGLQIKDLDGTVFLSWDEVYGNFQLSSLFHWAFTFREVRVVKPFVHLQINPDQSFNISDILQRLEENSAQRPPGEKASIPALRVENLQITNAMARVSDLTLRTPFHRQIGPVDLAVRKFYTHPDNENPYSITGSTESGERFAWSGRFFLFPLRSEGDLRIENVRLADYAPFYQDFVSLNLSDGVLDLGAHYRLEYGTTNNHLSVSNAGFHLANLKVNATSDSTQNALTLGDLKVAGVEADLWHRSARIQSVALRDGEIVVRRNPDQTINLIRMAQPSQPDTPPAGIVLHAMHAVTNLLANFLNTTNQAVAVIDRLNLNNCAVQLADDANLRPVRLRIDQINLGGTNLSNIPGKDLSLGLAFRWNTNGTGHIGVAAKLLPIHSDITIRLDDLELPPLDPYVQSFANVLLLGSKLSVDGLARVRREALQAPLNLDFEGNVRLSDFSSVEGGMGSDLAQWKSLTLSGLRAKLQPMEVHVDRIDIQDPKARIAVETNRTINVLNALQGGQGGAPSPRIAFGLPGNGTSPQPTDPKSAPSKDATNAGFNLPVMTVSAVVISNASLEIEDRSTAPPLRWSVTEANGEIGGLSSTNLQRAELKITAKAGGTAPMEITGELNPLNSAVNTDLAVKLDGMDLLPFGPYAARYAGYRLRKGSLKLDLQYSLRGKKLASRNLIVLDQLTLGQKVESAEATKLPVKLGVAVLKDRNGIIELDVPVEGNLDDPEFRLGRVIGHTIMITLTKMFTSPFSLLGGLVGGSAEEMSSFEFPPGSASLQLSTTNGLQKLAKALFQRPGLEVEIHGSVAADSDTLALKRQKLTSQLKQLRWQELRESTRADTRPEDVLLTPDLRIALLRKRYAEVFPSEARIGRPAPGLDEAFYERMTNKLLDQVQVSEDDFRRLASARADAVKRYLVEAGGVEPGRLYFTESQQATPREGSKVFLQLQ